MILYIQWTISTWRDRPLQGVVCVISVPLSISWRHQLVVNVNVQTLRFGIED